MAYWPTCSSNSVTYCFTDARKVNADGSESAVIGGGGPYVNCHGNGQSSGPCATDGSYWMEVGMNGSNAGNFTEADLETTYHWQIRTGKFSPDVMMLGNAQKTTVSGSATSGWALDIWAKPALKAYKNGCYSPSLCDDTTVAESVRYAMNGYLRTLGVGTGLTYPAVESSQLRDALRGTFISTNGMSQSWDFKADTFRVSAVSPHFLTDGKTVAPGYVKVFLPAGYVLGTKGYASLQEVTSENIALKVSNKDAKASVQRFDNGILVDTGVTHFSAPEPEVRLLPKGDTANAVTPAVTSAPAVAASTPAAAVGSAQPASSGTTSVPTLKKGATKTLASIYRTTASQRAKWAASGACSIRSGKLVAKSVAGTCRVTVSVLNSKKKYVVAARKSYKVA